MTTAAPIFVNIPNYVTYLCFSTDTSLETARLGYVKRFGTDPIEVVKDHNLIWVGPCPERQP